MSDLLDLNDWKLEASFENDPPCVIHKTTQADRANGIRSVAIVKRWVPQKPILGAGAFGTVHLEKEISGDNGTRAVKQLYKSRMEGLGINYKKELVALTKFSRHKVWRTNLSCLKVYCLF